MENADVSRIQGVCHVLYTFFGYPVGKVKLCQVLTLCDMCDRLYGGDLFTTHPQAAPKKPILNRVKGCNSISLRFYLKCCPFTTINM